MSIFAAEKKLRLGIWGLGRGLHLVSTARQVNVEIVAGCDFNPRFLDLFRTQIPQGQFTENADEFLSWDFDAVLLATFCPSHAGDAIRCLRAGKHVLSEVTAFHTLAEGVQLVEAVERSGLVYQMAENYPYTAHNRWLARKWREGLFGSLQYAEYSYIHDCLDLAYTYIDGSPVQPGHTLHHWRSWLPWHYYCTHSLGPVMVITGQRPVRVVSLPGSQRLAGHPMEPPAGLSGMASSLLEMDNGGIVRNLMGGCTNDRDAKFLYGTRGAAMILDGALSLRLGGRGHSRNFRVEPQEDEIGRLASSSGHGGGDFWTLYHFANQILHQVAPPCDIYTAADMTIPGIQAYRSALAGGIPQIIPNFRDPAVREAYRDDHFAPSRYDSSRLFRNPVNSPEALQFTTTMRNLLKAAEVWQDFHQWTPLLAELEHPTHAVEVARHTEKELPKMREAILDARKLLAQSPGGDAERVLREVLTRVDEKFLLSSTAQEELKEKSVLLADQAQQEEAHRLVTRQIYPQLEMFKLGFDDLPPLSLPQGYTIREWQSEADTAHWCTIIGESFGEKLTAQHFMERMVQHPGHAYDRILFVFAPNGEPAATASAYGDETTGYVHYVGCRPSHAGHKLGYLVNLAVLLLFQKRGCRDCTLKTDDHRLPALKTYARLGFRPLITQDSHPARWRALARHLALPQFLDWRGAVL